MRKRPASIGQLTEQVALGRYVLTGDGAGGATKAESIYAAEVWAHIRPLSGGERQASARIEERADYLIVVRYRDDMRPGDFARWNGRDLNVRFIRSRGSREHLLEVEAEMGAAT